MVQVIALSDIQVVSRFFAAGTLQCPFLTESNAIVEYPSGRQQSSYARYICNEGYSLTSTSYLRVCVPQGTLAVMWSTPTFLQACIRKLPPFPFAR